MNEKYARLMPIYHEEGLNKLQNRHILIIGLGGVGGFVTEALARTGIKNLSICDGDVVSLSNFNRQIIATDDTYNQLKTHAFLNRIASINKDIHVEELPYFIDEESIQKIDFSQFDLILDCCDDVKAKIMIIEKAKQNNVEIISSMGTANKTDPNGFKICDINQTSYCPLAKKMRVELKKREITHVKVCFSNEVPLKNEEKILASQMFVVGSASFVIVKAALDYLKCLN